MREKKRILVIDDEANLAKLMKLNLERGGEFEVTTASSGAEGLRQLQERAFDLVITDFVMPGMDGKAVLNAVKQIKPQCPVVLFSVHHDDPAVLTPDVLARADGIISKPMNHENLYRTIHEALARTPKSA
jgi:CheY-like chemotaxis protein